VTERAAQPGLVPRLAEARLAELAARVPAVLVGGPLGSGKTTLLERYRAAREDGSVPPRIADDVPQRDEAVREIGSAVDADPRPGRLVMAGSARLPALAGSLGDRLAVLDLWPLSMAERTGVPGDFPSAVFGDPQALAAGSGWSREQYAECMAGGGYPEPLGLAPGARRAWYDGYLDAVLGQVIQGFARVYSTDSMRRLIALIAERAGTSLSVMDLSVNSGLTRPTTRRYLSYLDTAYLTIQIPSWRADLPLVKSPKLYPPDSGLAAHLLGVDAGYLANPRRRQLAPLLATFAAGELVKALAVGDPAVTLAHLRNFDLTDVDFMLEEPGGKVVGISLAAGEPGPKAMKGLRWLRGRIGDRLHAGIVLHLGTEAEFCGDGIYAMPLSVLWGHRPLAAGAPRDEGGDREAHPPS